MNSKLSDSSLMPPSVAPVLVGISRPQWSVMIPTFNCAEYLRKAIESVLVQDPGRGLMQIEVVDDCSTKDDPEAVVRLIDSERVDFYRKPKNEGVVANFNTCIARARGQFIHILHGDDFVLASFYEQMGQALELNRDLAFVSCRSFVVDQDGEIESLSRRLPQLEKGSRDAPAVYQGNPFQTPSVVVRRDFYESSGGFLPNLVHTADWEMWHRAITEGGGLVLNRPLAAYREFALNDSSRLKRNAENIVDYLRLFECVKTHYTTTERDLFLQWALQVAQNQAAHFAKIDDTAGFDANRSVCQDLERLLMGSHNFRSRCKTVAKSALKSLLGRRN